MTVSQSTVLHVVGKSTDLLIEETPYGPINVVAIQRKSHADKPGVDLFLADSEGLVAHSHARMAAMWRVQLRTASPFDQVLVEFLSGHRVIGWQHRSENWGIAVDDVVARVMSRSLRTMAPTSRLNICVLFLKKT